MNRLNGLFTERGLTGKLEPSDYDAADTVFRLLEPSSTNVAV